MKESETEIDEASGISSVLTQSRIFETCLRNFESQKRCGTIERETEHACLTQNTKASPRKQGLEQRLEMLKLPWKQNRRLARWTSVIQRISKYCGNYRGTETKGLAR